MKWPEAIVEIVKSFNGSGRSGFALVFLLACLLVVAVLSVEAAQGTAAAAHAVSRLPAAVLARFK